MKKPIYELKAYNDFLMWFSGFMCEVRIHQVYVAQNGETLFVVRTGSASTVTTADKLYSTEREMKGYTLRLAN